VTSILFGLVSFDTDNLVGCATGFVVSTPFPIRREAMAGDTNVGLQSALIPAALKWANRQLAST
jgi:hypothetical protein